MPYFLQAIGLPKQIDLPIVELLGLGYTHDVFADPLSALPHPLDIRFIGCGVALLVYMVTSMLWSMLESTITKRLLGPIDPNVAAMAPTPM